MRTPKTWTASIATVVGVLAGGEAIGAMLFNLSDSHVLVSAFWAAVAILLSLLWGARLAVLFVVPTAAAFVTNELIATTPVAPGFYSAATQVAPVLLLALGLEEWSLRRHARTQFEIALFVLLLIYLAVAVCAGLYGSAACHGAARECQDVLIRLNTVANVDIILTAANVAGSGIAGGLVAIPSLAVLAGERRTPSQTPPGNKAADQAALRAGPLSLMEALSLWYVLRRRVRRREQLQLDEPAAIMEVHHTVLDGADQPMTFEVNIVPANRWTTYEYPVATAD